MGASVYMQPVKGQHLSIGAPSSFLAAMERAFGGPPWTFLDGDYHQLKAFAAALDSEDQRQAATEIAEAAMKHGEVRVWAEY